ncbi:ATP-dependent RNA helicase DbpA [Paralcaligenes ureilyticus]|uniref:ATP-dependent RNA helicase DbpA n=1 Tax=Paralcaligenes ureilyticus TaxID=627131 RepID=A0A4R3M7M2_9BURK|nr:ATP-dependent RNA helicase DbpA [Paralcaligenes ureilyticus]
MISFYAGNPTVSTSSFSTLALTPAELDNLEQLGYRDMTPIQAQSLPLILAGQDLIAQAKTGSGKTAAFGLGVLHKINPADFATQALVLCPTRELADQVANELRRLARSTSNVKILTVCGGTPIRPQIESLARGAHVIVGTPGRLLDHIERASIDLSTIHTLVLDEADRMVDMGFYDDIVTVVDACASTRQTLLFSATYPADIRRASARFLKKPAEVKVESLHDASEIEQHFYEIQPDSRNAAVTQLLEHFRPVSTLAFCNTKAQCETLATELRARGFSALALHGDLDQREREDVLVQFANQSCSVLIATDVAARGLDIQTLEAVINVDVTPDAEMHIHRIGRTGRGNEKGLALSLCAPQEMRWANLIEQYQGAPLVWSNLAALKPAPGGRLRAPMVTLCIQGGKKDKLRPGDLLGALTGDAGLTATQVGKINILQFVSFVALDRHIAKEAYAKLSNSNIKGRRFRMRFMPGN